MNFELTEQQKVIREAARKFAQEELLPGVLERDEKSEFPMEQFHKAGELGFIGLPYPKEYGGQGLGYMEYALAVEEVSKVDASFGIAFTRFIPKINPLFFCNHFSLCRQCLEL